MRSIGRTGWIVLLLLACNCARAPMGVYGGARPVPGAITAFDPYWKTAQKEGKPLEPPFVKPGTTNRALFDIGTVAVPWYADSVVVLIYGDNRPGLRMMTTPWGLPAVLQIGSSSPKHFVWAILNIPVFLVQGIVPRLDFFQDVISGVWTHRYSGGGERRIAQALIKELPANFVVNTGDLVENGRRGRVWEDFVRVHGELRSKAPFLATPGNHERLWSPEGRANWDAVMGPPAQPDRYWFAADLPDSVARFVFLDSELLADPRNHYPDSLQAQISREQIRWADSALAVPARWKFVVLHHPLVTSGHYLSDWKLDDSSPAEVQSRARLLDICRRRGVTAVFAGHEHLYQRTYVRGRAGKGFWHITTGGGGSPLYRLSEKERKAALSLTLPDSSHVTWSRARSMYHYCRLVLKRGASGMKDEAMLQVNRVRSNGKIISIDHIDLSSAPAVDTGP